jgi:GNAT superfamily N-acetyltransferase
MRRMSPSLRFEPCRREAIAEYGAYLRALSSPIDSYLETHILESAFFRILGGGAPMGFYAIHGAALLTQFYLAPAARRHAQAAYAEILSRHAIASAFAPTCDEFFLSHALDACAAVRKQAHFFSTQPGGDTSGQFAEDVQFRLAHPADLAEIIAVSGDFLEPAAKMVGDGAVRLGFRGAELITIGVIEPSRLFDRQASIGMFTRADMRGRGIGRHTIRYLIEQCRAVGVAPVAGCWYFNHASKRTLEAAGMVSSTRLLRIEYATVGSAAQ